MELSASEKQQYSRHLILDKIGLEGQLKLKQAKVLVVGAGGLGCPVLQYLSAAGVGQIGIIDDDTIDASNLQRQVLYTHEQLGQNKAKIAAERLQKLNPFVKFEVYQTRLTNKNALNLFEQYDIIVDGTDNFSTRYLVNDAAILSGKPIVFGSIFKFDGQVSVFNYENGPSYRCLYPTPPKPEEAPNCSEIGVLGVLPGIIGSLQANEVLKIILGLGNVLSGKLLTLDALSLKQLILSFKRNPDINIQALEDDYQSFCGVPANIKEIDFQQYKSSQANYNVLDVRTLPERREASIDSLHIPLDELLQRYHEIPTDKSLLVYCKTGIRSKLAIEKLLQNGLTIDLVNLKGGLSGVMV